MKLNDLSLFKNTLYHSGFRTPYFGINTNNNIRFRYYFITLSNINSINQKTFRNNRKINLYCPIYNLHIHKFTIRREIPEFYSLTIKLKISLILTY
jgi:hypothetical protein